MKTLLRTLFLLMICISAKSQSPTGLPAPNSPTGYYNIGWIRADSGMINALRDTSLRPLYYGTEIFWLHAGVDTAKWIWMGRWIKELKQGDANNGISLTSLSAISPIVYNNVTGVFSCPSCGSGSGGITTLNALTASSQTFATGISGSDFNIVSSGSTHTFNLPDASASTRGLLSTSDWTNFNAKQAQLNGTGFVRASGTTISYDNTVYYPNSNPNSFISRTGISALAPVLYNNSTGVISGDTSNGLTHFATQAYVLAHQASGTLTGAGNLSPLFTTSVVSNTLVFTLSNAGANSILGNNTGSTGPPSYFVPNATTINGWYGATLITVDSALIPQSYLSQTLVGSSKFWRVDTTSSTGLSSYYLRIKDSTIKYVTPSQLAASAGLQSLYIGPVAPPGYTNLTYLLNDSTLNNRPIKVLAPLFSTSHTDSTFDFGADTSTAITGLATKYQLSLKGSGTVTNVATGFGLIGGPITTTGTILADTSATALSGYYLRRKDTVGLAGYVTSMGINATHDSIFWIKNGQRIAFILPTSGSSSGTRYYTAGYDSAGNLKAKGPKIIDVVRDFGADTTFTTDCTNNFQAAIIMAYLLKGATVWVPTGHYKWSGAFDATHGNCQVWIPAQNPFTDSSYSFINIIGEGVNNVLGGGYNPSIIPPIPQTGVRIQSTITGTGSWPKIFGTYGLGGTFNYSRIYLKNLAILAYTNHATIAPNTGTFGFSKAAVASADWCTATLDTVNEVSIDPVNSESYGFAFGNINNSGPNVFNGLIATGTKYGYFTSEHSTYTGCHAYVCTDGVVGARVSYALIGNPILTHACNWQVYVPSTTLLGEYSAGDSYFDMTMEIEHDTYTGPTKWYNYVGDLKDSSNYGHGIIRYTIQDGLGAPHQFIVYGNQNIELLDLWLGYSLPHAFGNVGAIPFKSNFGTNNGKVYTTMPNHGFYVDSANQHLVFDATGSNISPLEAFVVQSNVAGQGIRVQNTLPTGYADINLSNNAGELGLIAMTGNLFSGAHSEMRISGGASGGLNLVAPSGSVRLGNSATTPGLTINNATNHTSLGSIADGAWLTLPAGTATAGTGPLKFTTASAVLLTTPVAGVMEVLADSLYYTGSSGSRVKVYPQTASAPGGSDTYVQYNLLGGLGGNSGLVYDYTNNILTVTSAATTENIRSISTTTSGTGHGNFYAQNTSSASEATAFIENNRGSLLSYVTIQAGGSANGNTAFGFSKADLGIVATGGTNNLGMAIGTFNGGPLIFGTSGTERGRLFNNGDWQIGGTTDIPSALFALTSTSKSFLPPRMNTTQQTAISSPANGSLLYNTDTSGLCIYVNSTFGWRTMYSSANLPSSGTTFANPSASIGLTAVNGSATTAMRSDAAPALSQSITPTMTGQWIFNGGVKLNGTLSGSGTPNILVMGTDSLLRQVPYPTFQQTLTASSTIGTNTITQTGKLGIGGNINWGPNTTLDKSKINFSSATLTDTATVASGQSSISAAVSIGQFTMAATNASVSTVEGYNFYVDVAPANGTNNTIVSSYSAGFGGNVNIKKDLSVQHVMYATNQPGIAAGTGAGTSPTVSIQGNDVDGSISVTAGTAPTGSNATIVTITFANSYAYPNNSFPIITPGNALTGALGALTGVSVTGNTTTWQIVSGTTGLGGGNTYKWYYHVGGK